jgi:hypothetical protein
MANLGATMHPPIAITIPRYGLLKQAAMQVCKRKRYLHEENPLEPIAQYLFLSLLHTVALVVAHFEVLGSTATAYYDAVDCTKGPPALQPAEHSIIF